MPDAALRGDRAAVHRAARRRCRRRPGPAAASSRCRTCRAATRGRAHLEQSYRGIDDLWDGRLDALIVTGTEPRAPSLADEPYWAGAGRADRLGRAQHHLDHLVLPGGARGGAAPRRHRAARARRQVLRHLRLRQGRRSSADGGRPHPACRFRIRAGTSLRESELVRARLRHPDALGTRPASTCFARQGRSLFVFFQGHPEYDAREPARRVSPRRRALPARRTRDLPGDAEQLFRRARPPACWPRSARAPAWTGARNCSPSFRSRRRSAA